MNNQQISEQQELSYEEAVANRYNYDYHEPPIMKWQSENFAHFVKDFCRPSDRILDLGCGPASMWPFWHKLLENPVQLVGVDLSPSMVAEAKRLYPENDFRVGKFNEIPFEDGNFDVVIVSSAFHHIADEYLPEALSEIHRVLDEHGILIGREPLGRGRLGDRGNWISGVLMSLRHLVYRLTNTREYPEPNPGPDHHAYDVEHFINILDQIFNTSNIKFRHPVSHYLARVRNPIIAKIAILLDESLDHKEGQEFFYVSHKNYADAADVSFSVKKALEENHIQDLSKFLAQVEASAAVIEAMFRDENGSKN